MKQDIKSAIKTAFPVAAVWFGALFGPSIMSGAYASAYFLPYGAYAVVLPFLAFSVICVFAALGADIVRRHGTYDYSSFARVLYGKFYRYLMPLLDYDILMAMSLGGAACIATVSSIMQTYLGVHPAISALVFSALAVVISVYGAEVVRRFSSFLTVVMMLCFALFAALFIYLGRGSLSAALSDWSPAPGHTLAEGCRRALILGLSNFGMVGGGLCAVEQKLKTGKECCFVGVISYVMNSILMMLAALMLMPFTADVAGSSTPTVTVMVRYVAEKYPFVTVAYFILMLLALISSAVPQTHAVTSRINRMLRDRGASGGIPDTRKSTLAVGIIYYLLCSALSFFGLTAIVSRGYALSSWFHLALLALPIALWHLRRLAGERRKKRCGS